MSYYFILTCLWKWVSLSSITSGLAVYPVLCKIYNATQSQDPKKTEDKNLESRTFEVLSHQLLHLARELEKIQKVSKDTNTKESNEILTDSLVLIDRLEDCELAEFEIL